VTVGWLKDEDNEEHIVEQLNRLGIKHGLIPMSVQDEPIYGML